MSGLQGSVPAGEVELAELWQVLSTVPDPRDPRGVRHTFATVLTLAAGAVLAGCCCTVAVIAAWAGDLPSWLARRVGVGRRPPRRSTFARVLAGVDGDVLDGVLNAWLATRMSAPTGMRALALDGKTARGARRGDGTRVHLVAVFDHATGTVAGQVEVASQGSEITAFAAVLDRVDLHGCVVTADALHTQTGMRLPAPSRRVLRVHGQEQPAHAARHVRRTALVTGPTRARAAHQRPRTHRAAHDPGHYRRAPPTEVPPRPPGRPDRAQRRHGPTGRTHLQVEFVITDLTPARADPTRLATLVRGHWGIENRLHWVRDVTYAEDHHALRTGHAPTVMATLPNTAISLQRQAGHRNAAATVTAIGRHPERVLDLIDRTPHPQTPQEGRL